MSETIITLAKIINTLGLCMDIIGALLLFRYGLPSELKPGGFILGEESPEDERARLKYNAKIRFWAHVGLTLLIIGFIGQLVASWID